MYCKFFTFNASQAKITAQWETGIKNRLPYITVFYFGIILLALLYQLFFVKRSIPITSYLYYAAGLAFYTVFVMVLHYKTALTAKKIEKRKFTLQLSHDEQLLTVYEWTQTPIFKTAAQDVTQLFYGQHILRICSINGIICLPKEVVPKSFLEHVENQLSEKNRITLRWM